MIISMFLTIVFLPLDVLPIQNRAKRVINGEVVLGRSSGYDAVRYFAEIATLHGDTSIRLWDFVLFSGYFGRLLCGGALLTPSIVQTACHCLSYPKTPDPTGRAVLHPTVQDEWESIMVVYVGVNKEFGDQWTMNSVRPLMSRKFMIHGLCGRLPNGTSTLTTHDFGWVSVDPSWDPHGKFLGRVDYAPLYTSEEVYAISNFFEDRNAVCLIMGFGIYNKAYSYSTELRHGWSVMISYSNCNWLTADGLDSLEGNNNEMSWFCMIPFSKLRQSIAPGDSGSPTTCNNFYVGIVFGTIHFKKDIGEEGIPNLVTIHSALKFSMYENSEDYRKEFMEFVEKYGQKRQSNHFDSNLPGVRNFSKSHHIQLLSNPNHHFTSSFSISHSHISLSVSIFLFSCILK